MNSKSYPEHSSSIGGIGANIVAAFAYLMLIIAPTIPLIRFVAFLLPLILFFVEKESYLVKFSAMQVTCVSLAFGLIDWVFRLIFAGSIVGSIFTLNIFALLGAGVYGIVSFVIWIATLLITLVGVMYSYNYKSISIPPFGGLIDVLIEKLGGIQ